MRDIKEIALIIESNAKQTYGSVNKMLIDNNLNKSVIDNMKREKPSIPNIEIICKITELLNLPIDWLLNGSGYISNTLQQNNNTPDQQELLNLYSQLDPIKQAEFKGELKGYLKAKNGSS